MRTDRAGKGACACSPKVWAASRSEPVKDDFTSVRADAMLHEKDALPRPKHGPTALDGDRQARLRQQGPQVRRHVVRPFVVMLVKVVLGCDPAEEAQRIRSHSR